MLIATSVSMNWKARGMGSTRNGRVNTLVACEVAYLFNARSFPVVALLKGLFGSRAVLISVAIVVVLQAMFTRALYAGVAQHHAARPGDMVAYRGRERRCFCSSRSRRRFSFAAAAPRFVGFGRRRPARPLSSRLAIGSTCRRGLLGLLILS
jgi:hypothetical protein